jgi:hypothetical protein
MRSHILTPDPGFPYKGIAPLKLVRALQLPGKLSVARPRVRHMQVELNLKVTD